MKSDVVLTMFALCLYHVWTMFAPRLHYVLMKSEWTKEGNRQQALGTSKREEGRRQRADRWGGGRNEK